MLDKETQEALEGLDENDVFKVGEMIRKLADENNKPTTRSNADDFVHKIERNKTGQRTDFSNLSTKRESIKIQKRENLFESMSERHHHKDDSEIDRKLAVVPPTVRDRGAGTIQVVCDSCNKQGEVSAVLVSDSGRYICNSCQTRGARG
jgi:hypothetical protein|tara:strand:+ start:123 stop:569 length:447 start_codon:yes stop_codon:yes gene_type:complete